MIHGNLTRRQFTSAVALGGIGAMSGSALAQSAYPNKPIKIVVGWPAGGGADVSVRLLVAGLSQRLGQPIVVDNKGGASGAIAHSLVARSPADGYTLLFSSGDTHSLLPHLYKDPQFAVKDFVGVASLGGYPMGLAVQPSIPVNNIAQLKAWAKDKKVQITFGTGGVGSAGHVLGEAFADMAKVDLLHVPYQGSAPMFQGMLGGQINAVFTHVAAMADYVRAGSVRLLAVTAKQRLPAFPDAPTFVEQGIPLENGSWGGILAPAGTPMEIVAKVHDAVEATLADPAPAELNKKLSTVVEPMSQVDFEKFIVKQNELWGKFIRDANIKLA